MLQAWSLYFLYALTIQIVGRLQQAKQIGVIKMGSTVSDVGSLFRLYHINYLMGMLAFYGGFTLLYNKKSGWMASVVSCLLFMGFMFVSGRNGVVGQAATKATYSVSYLIAGALFAALFILLILKPFRQKYKPTFANWLIMGGIVLLVIIDKQIF